MTITPLATPTRLQAVDQPQRGVSEGDGGALRGAGGDAAAAAAGAGGGGDGDLLVEPADLRVAAGGQDGEAQMRK